MAQNRQNWSEELKNVVIIGHSGAGKSSLINMLCSDANAPVGNNAFGCTTGERAYTCRLDSGQQYQVHDTIGLEEPTFALFPAPEANSRLKKYLRSPMRSGKLHLLIYCMPGERVGMRQSQQKNYKNFKKFVGRVPVVLVVTKLDTDLEGWWARNQNILQKLGMESEEHACVTTLSSYGRLYDGSRRAVEALIKKYL